MRSNRIAASHVMFLCHCHGDKRFVRRLAGDLRALGINVWLDEWELSPRDSLHGAIGEALEKSSYVGVVLSPDSIKSQWCTKELRQALSREDRTGRKIVIPLRYRKCPIPPFLEDKLYVDFTRSYFQALGELAGYLWGLDMQPIRDALRRQKPRAVDRVLALLSAAAPFQKKRLSKRQLRRIEQLLSELGVPVPDRARNMTAYPVGGALGVLTLWDDEELTLRRNVEELRKRLGTTERKDDRPDGE